jgi:hypothetical protein
MNKKIPDFFKKWGSDSFGGELIKNVGWVERSVTQHPDICWVTLRSTQPTPNVFRAEINRK